MGENPWYIDPKNSPNTKQDKYKENNHTYARRSQTAKN